MSHSYLFLDENKGKFTQYNQLNQLYLIHKKNTKNQFTGYCHGVCLSYIDNKINRPGLINFGSKDRFRLFINSKAIPLQKAYERAELQFFLAVKNGESYLAKDKYNYNNSFMQQFYPDFKLPSKEKISCRNILELAKSIKENSIIIMTAQFEKIVNSRKTLLHHTIVLMHDGKKWCYFNPNVGEVRFRDKLNFLNWLSKESDEGGLQVYSGNAVPSKGKEGIVRIISLDGDLYPHPKNCSNNKFYSKL